MVGDVRREIFDPIDHQLEQAIAIVWRQFVPPLQSDEISGRQGTMLCILRNALPCHQPQPVWMLIKQRT